LRVSAEQTANKRRQPRYREIADRLIGDIGRGRYPVGGLLPAEVALARRYAVSRHTMRNALEQLRALGLVKRRAGVGTRIEAVRPKSGYVLAFGSIDEILHYAADAPLQLLSAETVTVDESQARRIGCPPGSRFLRIEGLRRAADLVTPISWTEIYLALEFAALGSRIGREARAIHQMIADDFGVAIAEIRQEITAVAMAPGIASKLGRKPGAAGLYVTRRYLGPGDRLLQVSFSAHPEGLFTYSMRLTAEPPPG
jgi:DNA-binding GntR family transcriptional regulator